MDKKGMIVTLFVLGTVFLIRAGEPSIKPLIYPDENIYPQSIATDGKLFWVLDTKAKQIYTFDREMKKVIKSFKVAFPSAKSMTAGGSKLWIADEQEKKIYALNMTNGKIEKSFPIALPQGNEFKSIEGLAWDGAYLWMAVSAGFSGSFNKIDPVSGKNLRSFYAECEPRGIATNGKYLWSICFNGAMLSKIDQRPILEKDSDMLKAREFIADIRLDSPAGLIFNGTNFIINEQSTKKILIVLASRKLKK
jgi:DNA-binding beta-propeller fold protein YncE